MNAKPAERASGKAWAIANRHYLDLELERLRLLLERRIHWLRTQWEADTRQGYQGLVISDGEVARLLTAEPAREREFYARDKEAKRVTKALSNVAREIESLARVLSEQGGPPAMAVLVRTFELTPFERDVILLCVAPEIDPAFERLYAYIQDDATRKYPTPHLALSLLASEGQAAFQLRESFMPHSVLRRMRLLTLDVGSATSHAVSGAPLRLSERITSYVLGSNRLDERVAALLHPLAPAALVDAHTLLLDRLQQRIETTRDAGRWPAINLVGPPESGKRALARALCARVGLGVRELVANALPPPGPERSELIRLVEREALLSQFGVYLRADANPAATQPGAPDPITDLVEELGVFLIVGSAEPCRNDRQFVTTQLAKPDAAGQAALWHQVLTGIPNSVNGEIQGLVQQFSFGPAAIGRAVGAAQVRAQLRTADTQAEVSAEDLWAECRAHAGLELEALAQRISPRHTWDDIVLPSDTGQQLQEIAAQVALRHRVYEAWGFGAKLNRGRGISALFAGPSGTGKTLAAEILASHLDLDLFRIDLSGVVSKYIGETEKNLRRVFDAAERGGVILFFDEADALFGKRSEVKDSHDRYANIEVNYLLQRMEDYRGLAILATNKKSHLDQAFMRRLRFLVDFPFPDAAQRAEIWKGVFPARAETATLDYSALARLEVSGGNIKNIALNAAFLAADHGGRIGMEHVYRAARREYVKIDKLVSDSEFGRRAGA